MGMLGEWAERALSHGPAEALAAVEAHVAVAGSDDRSAALLAFLQVLNCDFDAAVSTVPADGDALSRCAREFVLAVCLAEMPDPRPRDEPDPEFLALQAFLLVESAMSAGQIARADLVARELEPALVSLGSGVSWAWNRIALARSQVFQGRLVEASATIEEVLSDPRASQWPAAARVAVGVRAFVAALAGDTAPAEEFATGLLAERDGPGHYLESGAYILAAFAEQAAGRLERLGDLVLRGGGGVFLQRYQMVDRTYAYEALVEAALAAGDLVAAGEWLDRAESLPVDAHDMASAALGRTRARYALACADPETGARESARSAERAAVVGGDLEVRRGHLLRDWAVRELGLLGRRLRNAPGLGWTSLTDQQQRVALLAAQGLRNREIGEHLFLSERTVEGHISAVLDVLGSPSRVGIGQHVPVSDAGTSPIPAALTPRQRDVAALVAGGSSNAEIAASLGISEKTVEKHLNDVFGRLGVRSRAAVAAAVRG